MWTSKARNDFRSTAAVAVSRRTSSTSSLGSSSTSKRIPAATTSSRSVFVSKTKTSATPSSFQGTTSLSRTPQPAGNVAYALSMLSSAAGINATSSTGLSSSYSAVDDTQLTRLNSDDDAPHTEDEDRYEEESIGEAGGVVIQETQDREDYLVEHMQQQQQQPVQLVDSNPTPPEWEGLNPDIVLKCLKAVKTDSLRVHGLRDFFKSYSSWVKMTPEQRNKSLSWFRSLPENLQGLLCCCCCVV
jgi:hypothetical protein